MESATYWLCKAKQQRSLLAMWEARTVASSAAIALNIYLLAFTEGESVTEAVYLTRDGYGDG